MTRTRAANCLAGSGESSFAGQRAGYLFLRGRGVSALGVVLLVAGLTWGLSAQQARASTYRGKTSQDLAISIIIKTGSVRQVRTTVRNNCGGRHPLRLEGLRTRIDSDGRFLISFSLPGGGVRVAGRLQGQRLTGTVRERVPGSRGQTCGTGRLRFATRRS